MSASSGLITDCRPCITVDAASTAADVMVTAGLARPTPCLACRRAVPELYDEGIVTLKAGDALKDSAVDQYEPFDAIHVGASAGHVPKVCTFA